MLPYEFVEQFQYNEKKKNNNKMKQDAHNMKKRYRNKTDIKYILSLYDWSSVWLVIKGEKNLECKNVFFFYKYSKIHSRK